MLLKDYIPAADVQEFVQLYRIVHLQFKADQPVPFKAYPPRPEHCLVFYPYDTETIVYKNSGKTISHLPVVLYGQFTEVTNRYIGRNFLALQIIFYPGALFRLTGIPAEKISNEYLDAELVFSSALREINEQLFHANGYAAMIEILDKFVRTLIKKQQKPRLLLDDACNFLLNNNGNISLDKLAKQACLSARQLERKFKERTGVNPKLYSRIIRFDKAFRLKNTNPELDWLRIALESDYYDYQHLVRDYKEFTLLSPTHFHEIENNAPERKFGLREGFIQ